jgi:hypothetical protein
VPKVLVLLLLNASPLLLLGLVVWLYTRQRSDLSAWRKRIFVCALIANAVSAALLLLFVAHALLGSGPADLDRMYPVLSAFSFGLLAAVLACAGMRSSRILLACDGVLTMILWYMAAMAASV